MFHFHTAQNCEKTSSFGFLTLSEGIEMEPEKGQNHHNYLTFSQTSKSYLRNLHVVLIKMEIHFVHDEDSSNK